MSDKPVDLKRAFGFAAYGAGVKQLAAMNNPVEERPEGRLTAVSRQLYTEGEVTNHPKHPNGIAPDIQTQLTIEFQYIGAKYVAFHSGRQDRAYNVAEGKEETVNVIRYAYIK